MGVNRAKNELRTDSEKIKFLKVETRENGEFENHSQFKTFVLFQVITI